MPSSIDLRAEVRAETVALQPHAHYVHAFVESPVASVIWSPENRILDVNQAMCEFVGFEHDDLIGRTRAELTYPDDVEEHRVALAGMDRTEVDCIEYDKRYVRSNGVVVWGHLTAHPVRDETGLVEYWISTIEDIAPYRRVEEELRGVHDTLEQRVAERTTELLAAQHTLVQSEERFRRLAENATDLIYRIRFVPEPAYEYINPALGTFLGYRPEDFYANANLGFRAVHRDDRERLMTLMAEEETDNDPDVADDPLIVRMVHRNGEVVWTEHRLVVLRDAAGVMYAVEGVARDVTRVKAVEADLSHRALHDALTELPNRSLLLEHLELALVRRARHPESLAVIYLDLDRFKTVNDNLGHPSGDRLLVTVARRLQLALRPTDTVARLGGDEFAAVLPDLTSADEAMQVAQRVVDSLTGPVDLGENEVVVGCSVGVAFAGADAGSAGELLRRADVAMYAAKDNGRSQVVSYSGG
jgi:diguanylate cyclase (GGDEF)-like protein/PAS domain S-box-containing protein